MATRPVNTTYVQPTTVVNTPGGGNTMVQYNDNGKFAGDNGLKYNKKLKDLSVQGNINVGGWVKGKIYTNTHNFFLTGGSPGQVLGTDGYGNLNWVNQDGTGTIYSNSNAAAYFSTFTGNISAGNIKTDNLLYANGAQWVFGSTYSNANVASYLPTYTGNINGSNINISNTVYTSNLSSTDTAYLTTLNVNATATFSSVSNVVIPGGTNGQVLTTNGSNVLSWTSIPSNPGLTVGLLDGSNVATSTFSNVTNIGFDSVTGFNVTELAPGNIKVSLGSSWKTWEVAGQDPLIAVGEDTVTFVAGTNMSILTNATAKSITFNSSGGGATLPIANGSSNIDIATSSGPVTLTSNNYTFSFNDDATIDLPSYGVVRGNTVNMVSDIYSQLQWVDSGNLNISNPNDSAGPKNWAYVDSDGFWVETNLNQSLGNISHTWYFDTDGNLKLPGTGSIANPINSSLDPLNPNVSTLVFTPDQNYSFQSLVLDPTAPGHIHLRSPSYSSNIDEPAANLFLGGELSSFEVGAGTVPNVYIHSNNYTWTYTTNGDINIPPESHSFSLGRIQSANGYPTILGYGSGPQHGGPELDWMDGDDTNNLSDPAVLRNTLYINDNGLYVGLNENNKSNAYQGSFSFTNTGNLILPNVNNSQKSITGTTELIYGDPYPAQSTAIPSVVWTASSANVLGAKMTMRVQSYGGDMEMFDILMAKEPDGANVSYVVSNRIKTNDLIADTTANVDINGSNYLTVTLTSQLNSYITYSVTEFNRTFD